MKTTAAHDAVCSSASIQLETEEKLSTRQEQTMQAEAEDHVWKSLSPLINSMRVFGLYFSRDSRIGTETTSQPSWQSLRRCQSRNAGRVYSTVILAVVWITAFRYCVIFDGIHALGVELLMKLGLISSVLLYVLLHTAYYVASHTGSLDRVFRRVNLSTADISPKYSRLAKVLTTICWLLLAFCMFCYIYPMSTNGPDNDETLLIFINTFRMPKPYAEIVKAVFVVIELQCTASWLFPQAMKDTVLRCLRCCWIFTVHVNIVELFDQSLYRSNFLTSFGSDSRGVICVSSS